MVHPSLPLLTALTLASALTPSPDRLFSAGLKERQAGHLKAAEKAFAQAAALNPSAANWRALADTYVADHLFAEATAAYDQAALRYRQKGDTVTALALEYLAAPYRQELSLYSFSPAGSVPSNSSSPSGCSAAARLEPARGLLLGTYVDEQRQRQDGPIDVSPMSTDDFAVYFRYWTLKRPGAGEVFPAAFAASVRRAQGALHLALEPGLPLSEIDDRVLLPFAEAAKRADLPIFVRFASEFNDPANAWSRDPALYRKTFRKVAETLHRLAPNVAMVWMPMASRLDVVDRYYPGADAVDWVGVSLYSVPYPNGHLAPAVDTSNPLSALRPFYDRYSCRHPFQVSEYASSSRSGAAPAVDFTPFAVARMREMYWGAALTMPRLKNINWLDIDGTSSRFVITKTAERRNDYRLFNVPAKVDVLRGLRSEPVFLKRWPEPGPALPLTVPLQTVPLPFPSVVRAGQPVRGAVWLKTFQPAAQVEIRLDGMTVSAEKSLPYRFTLPAARLTPGAHTLSVWAQGTAGNMLLSETRTVTARP